MRSVNMRGSRKSQRLSWAPDVDLCQVRLFLSEESPSQAGFGIQDHLQAKESWPTSSIGLGVEDSLPPGFESVHPPNQLHINLSEISLIEWRCPSRFELSFEWQVVSGEESKEVEFQRQREMRVLEAYYPRPSAIPPNPTDSPELQDSHSSDCQIQTIPINPIEDEETVTDTPFDIPMSSQPTLSTPSIVGVTPDVVAAAASAAMDAISKNGRANIDEALLAKVLNNPEMIKKVLADYGPGQKSLLVSSSAQMRPHVPLPNPSHTNKIERSVVAPVQVAVPVAGPSASWYPPPNGAGSTPAISPGLMGVPPAKDLSYYKNLIHQHGGERSEMPLQFGSRNPYPASHELVNCSRPRDSKNKIMKPCMYFNSSKGCWHGANCAFQHDPSVQQRGIAEEGQNAKRTKLDREITS